MLDLDGHHDADEFEKCHRSVLLWGCDDRIHAEKLKLIRRLKTRRRLYRGHVRFTPPSGRVVHQVCPQALNKTRLQAPGEDADADAVCLPAKAGDAVVFLSK